MSQYLLINRVQVQGANAVAGFTWGFPAITHFLGFAHNLSRKLQKHAEFSDIELSGCAVIAHEHQVHTYGYNQFTQSRNPPYLKKHSKCETPPVIEEGKMNMNISLLIACEGNIGNRKDALVEWLNNACMCQRLAGGTILDIADIDFITVDDEQNRNNLRSVIRKLLPGFVLQDRSADLEKYFNKQLKHEPDSELFDAWLDFIALKQKARPVSNLINQYLSKQLELNSDDKNCRQRWSLWQAHLEQPYEQETIPDELRVYFDSIASDKKYKKLLSQWQDYCNPNEKTTADWQYIDKPENGFLVPIMVGYKAISPVYPNSEVANTRDNETDVCFVEAVHSIGEWQGVHRIRDEQALRRSLWRYQPFQKHWYLCAQRTPSNDINNTGIQHQNPEDDFS